MRVEFLKLDGILVDDRAQQRGEMRSSTQKARWSRRKSSSRDDERTHNRFGYGTFWWWVFEYAFVSKKIPAAGDGKDVGGRRRGVRESLPPPGRDTPLIRAPFTHISTAVPETRSVAKR